MFALTITDLSGDTRDEETLYFRTEAAAKGHVAKVGNYYGHREFRLNSRICHPDEEYRSFAEEPIGYRKFGRDYLYAEAV